MFSQDDKVKFFDAIESLKKYRRADLVDEKGRSVLKELYTDLLPDEHILRKSLKDNTTFLIGRKGTGKSTIFLRIEQELRGRDDVLPCYLDVKTIHDSAHTDYLNLNYLSEYLSPKATKKYLVERSFLQSILSGIIKEIDVRYNTIFERIKAALGVAKAKQIKERLKKLKDSIEDNESIKEIEIPTVKNIATRQKSFNENTQAVSTKYSTSADINFSKDPSLKSTLGSEEGTNVGDKNSVELEETFTNVFLQVFQIKEYINDIKSILKDIGIKHVVVLLDDFSEIEDAAIRVFVDVILAPLNNWSEEFIKLKVAAYPNRIYYGKIDLGKIDTINLDFFNLYSEFDRNKMEEGAIDFTRRLIEKRIDYYLKKKPDIFFDTSKLPMKEYYELLFQTSMNVPRIIGYILSFCYQTKIIYNRQITRQDIESAAQKYYEDKIETFFHKMTFSLLSLDEKIDTLQLEDLLDMFVVKMGENKKRITTKEASIQEYAPELPYTSHFHFSPALENFLKTLELNFFISKYTEMTNRDGDLSSVFCLNYGLAKKHSLLWGKPEGTQYRKYFVSRLFNFNPIIKEFLLSSKSIHCTNEDCKQTFTQEQLSFLEFSEYKCNKCGSAVIVESTSESIKSDLSKIKETDLLTPSELEIIMGLVTADEPKIAKEIAEEADLSKQFVAQKSRSLDLHKGLVKRVKENEDVYTYELTELGKATYGKE